MERWILILVILLSFNSLACENVNFYETHSEIHELPIVNQGALNTCYAHTLTTVYNLEYTSRDEERVDDFWTAFVHKKEGLHWSPGTFDYSLLSLAWADLKKYGFCDPSEIKNVLEQLKSGVPYTDGQLFYVLRLYFGMKNKLTRNEVGQGQVLIRLLNHVRKHAADKFEVPWSLKDLESIFNPIQEEVRKMTFFDWLNTRVFKNCKERSIPFADHTMISLGRGNESNLDLADTVRPLLKSLKPISVGYCYQIFKNPNFSAPAMPRVLKIAKSKCSPHYSTLVGMRNQNGSCQYLVRNSYGTGFWAHENFECWCREKDSGLQRNCTQSERTNPQLEVLGCWIDRDDLLTNTFDLSYFK